MGGLDGAFASKRASDDSSDARSCASGGASDADLLPAGRAGGLAVGGRLAPRPEAAFGAAEASLGLEGAVAMVAAALCCYTAIFVQLKLKIEMIFPT